jgi:spore maturation protein CgeB
MRVLLVGPGASWSTADVADGLRFGLEKHGVQIVEYRLDTRIARSSSWMYYNWRRTKKDNPGVERPTTADVFHWAGRESVTTALWHEVDAIIVVSAMFLLPDIIKMMTRAHIPVFVLFTESPYDMEAELRVAAMVDGCWTNERSALPAFRAVNPNSGYLRHAWHPVRHVGPQETDAAVPAHDVVFVGSAFQERIDWLTAIDWSGIDLGLYGSWAPLGSTHRLRAFVRDGVIDNATTAALYRRAKLGLNLYRTSQGWGKDAPQITHAESLNPRAYELAACGAFHLSTDRAEVREVFGSAVPTFTDPQHASALIRAWLADDAGRIASAQQLPAMVAESSWVERSATVIGDIQSLLQSRAA